MTTENTVVSTLHIRPNIPEFCSAFGKKENVKVESGQCRMSKETWRAQAESCTEQPERIHAIWKEGAHAKGFRIRGKTYMDDKVKIQAANPLFELVWLDMFHSKRENLFHVSRNPKSFVQRALSKYGEEIPQLFVINILLPGSPEISITQYFALRKEVAEEMDRNPNEAMKLWKKFLEGDDAFRNSRFKMIPEIQEGPWLVKKSVGGNPSLIAKALQVSWFRGTKYLEAVVDVSSDRIAKHITSLCRRHATSLVVDIGFVIEGTDESELPESLLACVRYNRPNCEDALPLE